MSPPDPQDRPKALQGRTALVSLLLAGILVAAFSWWSFDREKRHQIGVVSSILDISVNSVDSYFRILETALNNLGDDLADIEEPADLGRIYPMFRRFQDNRPELNNVSLIRPDGQILLTGRHPPAPSLPSLNQTESFRRYIAELSQGNEQAIGRPMQGAIRGSFVIPLRHPVRDRSGELRYIVSATIPVDFVKSLWKDALLTRTSLSGLIRDDAYLVTRYPLPPEIDAKDIYGQPREGVLTQYLRANAFPAAGQLQGLPSLDPVETLYVFRRLPSYPLTMFLTTRLSDLRSAWWENVQVAFVLAVLGLLAGLGALRVYDARQKAWNLEQLRINEALRQITANYNELVARIPVGVYRLRLRKDGALCYEYVSQKFCQILNVDMVDALQDESAVLGSVHPDDLERLRRQRREAVESASSLHWEGRLVVDGQTRWIRMESNCISLPDGDRLWNGVVGDITQGKQAEAQLWETKERLEAAASAGIVGIWDWDVSEGRLIWDKVMHQLYGLEEGTFAGTYQAWLEAIHQEDRAAVEAAIQQALADARDCALEFRVVRPDGAIRHLKAVCRTTPDSAGRPVRIIGVSYDQTEQKLTQIELDKLAFYDRLTGLPNRRLLEDRLEQLIARAAREHGRIALLFIDLDKFKPINDELGHATGDWLLQRVAGRMEECLRKSDTVARIGGDEFVVLLPDAATTKEAASVAEKIRASLADPFVTEEQEVLNISSSIGVVLFPDHADNSRDLIRVGDEAMYRAKKAGRNAVQILAIPSAAATPGPTVADHSLVRLVWKTELTSGDPSLDEEHQDLFRRANLLLDLAFALDADPDRFRGAFDALLFHTAAHFSHEEEVLQACRYDGLARHAAMHAKLLSTAKELRRQAEQSQLPVGRLVEFLASELVAGHMLREDAKFHALVAAMRQSA